MTKVHVLFAVSLFLACTLCTASSLEGRRIHLSVQKTPRIRGGTPVIPGEIPYAAGLIVQQPIGNRFCGGSLVSLRYVLTAANCFNNPEAVTVLLGATNMTDVEDIVMADEVILHQGFVASQNLNDIALVRLFRQALVTNYIALARLPNWRQVDSLFVNQRATVSGWGALGQNSPEILPLNNLYRVSGSVIGNTACNLQFLGGIVDSHVCVETSEGSPCQGDHGGPLTVQDADGRQTVIGVFSFTSVLGCNLDWPAVYTRLTPYLSWIEANSDVVIWYDFDFFPPVVTSTTTPQPTHQDTTPTQTMTPISTTETLPTTTTPLPTTTTTTPLPTTTTPLPTTTTPLTSTTDLALPPHRTNSPDVREHLHVRQ